MDGVIEMIFLGMVIVIGLDFPYYDPALFQEAG